MNREDILKVEAGREIDDLIHQTVFGAIAGRNTHGAYGWLCNKVDNKFVPVNKGGKWDGNWVSQETPEYSTDIAAAWEVVLKMSSKNYWCVMEVLSSRSVVMFEEVKTMVKHQAQGNEVYDLPLAICRAALLAVMEVVHE